jgi:hypothetical protein
MSSIEILFVLLLVYQLKHFLADYILQGKYMLGKFKPKWDFLGPLLAHVGVHAVMTFSIVCVALQLLDKLLPTDFVYAHAVAIAMFDGIVHFFMDRIKAGPRYMGRWKPISAAEYPDLALYANLKDEECEGLDFERRKNSRKRLRGNTLFWWALGFDQMVHHVTHYACIYFILKLAGVI